jgi:hypothetical protein
MVGSPTPRLTGGIPMNEPNDNNAPKGLRGWWATPPRSGIHRVISPVSYRHLRTVARVRIAAGIVLAGIGATILVAGSFTTEAVVLAILFLAAAVGSFAWAAWYLAIARAAADRT